MMTPLDFYFYTIFGAGCVLAGVLSLIASGCRWLSATLLLATAICIFWSESVVWLGNWLSSMAGHSESTRGGVF